MPFEEGFWLKSIGVLSRKSFKNQIVKLSGGMQIKKKPTSLPKKL